MVRGVVRQRLQADLLKRECWYGADIDGAPERRMCQQSPDTDMIPQWSHLTSHWQAVTAHSLHVLCDCFSTYLTFQGKLTLS